MWPVQSQHPEDTMWLDLFLPLLLAAAQIWNNININKMISDPESGYGQGPILGGFLPEEPKSTASTATTTTTSTSTTTTATAATAATTTTVATTTTAGSSSSSEPPAIDTTMTVNIGPSSTTERINPSLPAHFVTGFEEFKTYIQSITWEAGLDLSLQQLPAIILVILGFHIAFRMGQATPGKIFKSSSFMFVPFSLLGVLRFMLNYLTTRKLDPLKLLEFVDDKHMTEQDQGITIGVARIFCCTILPVLLQLCILANTRTDQISYSTIISLSLFAVIKTSIEIMTYEKTVSITITETKFSWKAKFHSFLSEQLKLLWKMMLHLSLILTNLGFNLTSMTIIIVVCVRLHLHWLYFGYFGMIFVTNALFLICVRKHLGKDFILIR